LFDRSSTPVPRFGGGMRVRWISVPLAGMLAAVVATSAVAADGPHTNEHYVLISHAADSDVWWNTIKNAIKQAGDDYGVQVDYRNPSDGDLADMARLLQEAAARKYD